jgi:hypothetical protein
VNFSIFLVRWDSLAFRSQDFIWRILIALMHVRTIHLSLYSLGWNLRNEEASEGRAKNKRYYTIRGVLRA